MKIHERFRVQLNPLLPRMDKTSEFKTPWASVNMFLDNIPPRMRNRILNYGVGVEIEVEGSLGLAVKDWNREGDGSLRNNGQEYKTTYGARIHHLLQRLVDLQNTFDAGRKIRENVYNFTERTSVHVHLDVRNFDQKDLNSLLVLYVMFERALFRFAGESRVDNIFCVPILESDKCIPEGEGFGAVMRAEKYCALNMKTVAEFGTVEFRHMEGTSDAQTIFTWVLMLACLLYAAETLDRAELYNRLLKLKVESQYLQALESIFHGLSVVLPWKNKEIDAAVSDAKFLFNKEF